jgi:3-phenylpropionate/trans-cinnamate dioxygenase ferredoxin component
MKSALPTGAKATEVREGEMQVVNVAGTKVALTRIDGRLHAFDDTCTHAGCSLAGGDLEGSVVTCRCHGSQFDATTGVVLRGPAQRPVRSHAVTTEGDDVLVEP